MRCDHVIAVLDGEAPAVAVAAHLETCASCRAHADALAEVDALAGELPELELPSELALETWELLELELAASALPELEPPADLIDRTLAAMEAEQLVAASSKAETVGKADTRGVVVQGPWLRRVGGGALALLVAALALVVVLPTEGPADLDRLVERGVGERLPEVSLKVAVEHGGTVARHRLDQRYPAGDTLYFRAQVDQPAWLALVRVDRQGATLVHAEQVDAGEVDLRLGEAPLAWRIEAGESDAVFALVATVGERAPSELVSGLASVNADAEAVCKAITAQGARCAAVPVGVQP